MARLQSRQALELLREVADGLGHCLLLEPGRCRVPVAVRQQFAARAIAMGITIITVAEALGCHKSTIYHDRKRELIAQRQRQRRAMARQRHAMAQANRRFMSWNTPVWGGDRQQPAEQIFQ